MNQQSHFKSNFGSKLKLVGSGILGRLNCAKSQQILFYCTQHRTAVHGGHFWLGQVRLGSSNCAKSQQILFYCTQHRAAIHGGHFWRSLHQQVCPLRTGLQISHHFPGSTLAHGSAHLRYTLIVQISHHFPGSTVAHGSTLLRYTLVVQISHHFPGTSSWVSPPEVHFGCSDIPPFSRYQLVGQPT